MNRRRFEASWLALRVDALDFLFTAPKKSSFAITDGIALLAVEGPLERKADWYFDGYDRLVAQARDAFASNEVRGIVLTIDSPGGDAMGMIETANDLRALSRQTGKPLIAFVEGEACSASYCIATAAEAIVLTPTSVVGSIGVYARIADRVAANAMNGINAQVIGSGKYKGELHPDRALTPETTQRVQDEVNSLAGQFAALVAQNRKGLTADKVLAQDADTFRGQAAIDAGLADKIGLLVDAIALCRSRAPSSGTRASASSTTRTTAARPSTPPRDPMYRDLLIRMLGLASGATDDDIATALRAKNETLHQLAGNGGTFDAIVSRLSALIATGAKLDQAQADLTAAGTKLAKLETDNAALAAKVEAAEKAQRDVKKQSEIDALCAAGKLPPSMKATALVLWGTDGWSAFLDGVSGLATSATVTTTTSANTGANTTGTSPRTQGGLPGGQTPNASASGRVFDATEIAVLTKMGLTEEQARQALAERHRNSTEEN